MCALSLSLSLSDLLKKTETEEEEDRGGALPPTFCLADASVEPKTCRFRCRAYRQPHLLWPPAPVRQLQGPLWIMFVCFLLGLSITASHVTLRMEPEIANFIFLCRELHFSLCGTPQTCAHVCLTNMKRCPLFRTYFFQFEIDPLGSSFFCD